MPDLKDFVQMIREGRPEEARRLLDIVAKSDPGHVAVHAVRAMAFDAENRLEDAVDAWRTAHSMASESPAVAEGLRRALRRRLLRRVRDGLRSTATLLTVGTAPESPEPTAAASDMNGFEKRTGLPEPIPAPSQSPYYPTGWETVPATVDLPIADLPVSELPTASRPIFDPPVPDLPTADRPIFDPPVTDLPTADLPIADPPVAEPPPVDSPVADFPMADLSPAYLPVADLPEVDPPIADLPAAAFDDEDLYDSLGPLATAGESAADGQATGGSMPDGALDDLIRELESARIVPDPTVRPAQAADIEPDVDDVVSETLAKIYTTQKFFEEAAAVYDKLASQQPARSEEFRRKASDIRARIKQR